jgi:hypothetical protein
MTGLLTVTKFSRFLFRHRDQKEGLTDCGAEGLMGNDWGLSPKV